MEYADERVRKIREQPAVYQAMLSVWGHRFQTHREAQRYVDSVLTSRWWRDHYGESEVTVVSTATSFGWVGRSLRQWIMGLPDSMLYEVYVLHELAHVALRERDDKNPHFARVFLHLVARFAGLSCAVRLLRNYRKLGVFAYTVK